MIDHRPSYLRLVHTTPDENAHTMPDDFANVVHVGKPRLWSELSTAAFDRLFLPPSAARAKHDALLRNAIGEATADIGRDGALELLAVIIGEIDRATTP